MEFVSVARAADRLGLTHRAVSQTLAATGLARPARATVDGQPLFDREAFNDLASRPVIDRNAIDQPTLMVKLGPPRADVDGRPMGYSIDYDGQELMNAYRMYWRVADAEQWIEHPLVAVTCGFVVAAARISGVERHPGGLIEFEVDSLPTDLANFYEGGRLQTYRGGVIEFLGPQD